MRNVVRSSFVPTLARILRTVGLIAAALSLAVPASAQENGTSSIADLNEAGQATGLYTNAQGIARAFLYTNGRVYDIGDEAGSRSQGNAINARGEVAGTMYDEDDNFQAFLFSNGKTLPLNVLASDFSQGLYLNDSGWVVGHYGKRDANGRSSPQNSSSIGTGRSRISAHWEAARRGHSD